MKLLLKHATGLRLGALSTRLTALPPCGGHQIATFWGGAYTAHHSQSGSVSLNTITRRHYTDSNDAASSLHQPCRTIEDFRERAERGVATSPHARTCLEHTRASLKHLSLPEMRHRCEQIGVGGRILHWLWDNHHRGNNSIYTDKTFSDNLLWFLVPEGLEEFIWKWIEADAAAAEAHMSRDQSRIKTTLNWTKQVLGALAAAHIYWAPNHLLDDALRSFQRGMLITGGDPHHTVILTGSGVMISKALRRATSPPCDAQLFEYFQRCIDTWETRAGMKEHPQARLALYHPSKPNAQPLLRMTKSQPDDLERMLESKSVPAANSISMELLRAAYVLRLQGAAEDAGWMETIVSARNSFVWDARGKILAELDADPKLQPLRKGSIYAPPNWAEESIIREHA